MQRLDSATAVIEPRAEISDFGGDARLLPAPHTAAQKAALEAALIAQPKSSRLTRSRMLIGTGALALAVTVPNLSLGAMSAPFFAPRETPAPNTAQQAQVSAPAKAAQNALYASTIAADETAPIAPTFSSRSSFGNFDRVLPLAVLDMGSERFDLTFASVEKPSPIIAPVSGRLARASAGDVSLATASPIQTRNIAIEQITDRPLVARVAPGGPRPVRAALSASTVAARTEAIASQSVEAAFAGAIDVSGDVRSSLPLEQKQGPRVPAPGAPDPRPEAVARAVPIPAPAPEVSANAAAQAVLVPKTTLDARINGVLTGSVEFRQLDGTIAINLRSVANMLRDRFSAAEFDRMMSGRSIDAFVPLSQLQAAGIPISYNPAYDEVEFGIDYQDAPNANKVQVEQIGVPTMTSETVMIDQIPR